MLMGYLRDLHLDWKLMTQTVMNYHELSWLQKLKYPVNHFDTITKPKIEKYSPIGAIH